MGHRNLMQGMYETRPLRDFDSAPYNLVEVSRRGRLHVGPRYKARGLNDYAEPGNEIECEQIVWKAVRPHQAAAAASPTTFHWSRYVWRRGSVPLWWSVKIKNQGMGEAEIKIQKTNTFRGSRRCDQRFRCVSFTALHFPSYCSSHLFDSSRPVSQIRAAAAEALHPGPSPRPRRR